ncbi:CoA transferase subunit A [Brevibacillus choshinensis]|uniref:CoA transferase subunit A n=1 Tax=Brevibacillus choshinensis TaxID=54911 RepID=A0ABX7FHP5_BRECH|nr:CoA transferase subunit A [Brevibacillus choshinensis]QRG65217.1 CoA transferase subunit A [Brevibacillus choshinensis]
MEKFIDVKKAAAFIKDGNSLMVGGFGLVGSPLAIIAELVKSSIRNLTIISNNLGEPGKGLGELVLEKRVKKAIGSYFTSNPDVVKANQSGELEIELMPQGTLSEAIRAGGAGIGGFYVPAGVGTQIEDRKEVKVIQSKSFLFQEALRADVAIIKAHKADKLGNLVYRKSARNFNPIMATAADMVIAEVDEIVEVGELSPEEIVTPHLFINYVTMKGDDRS